LPYSGGAIKVQQAHYRPLFWASLGLDRLVWGTTPFGYHLTNLLLHMANACLLYRLLSTLLSRPLVASAISLLWALHPIQTEAVAWVSGRVVIVATLFLLIGLVTWLQVSPSKIPFTRLLGLGLAGLSFFFALLSHELAVIYPLLIIWILWYRDRSSGQDQPIFSGRVRWLGALLLLAPLAAYLAIRMTVAPFGKDLTGGSLFASPGLRLVVVLLTLTTYLRLLLFPISLSLIQFSPPDPSTATSGPWFWLAIGLLAVVVWTALRLRAASRAAFFGVGWFVLTLLPVSNIIPLYWGHAERYLYLSSVGFCIALVMTTRYATERLRKLIPALAPPTILTALLALLALLYAGRTVARNRDWRDDLTLASATVAASPESAAARLWLGSLHQEQGRQDPAIEQFMEARRLRPDEPRVYSALAGVYEAIGRDDLAREALLKRAQLDPVSWEGHYDLGLFYQRRGEQEKAFEAFDRAVRRDPRSIPALNALAAATLNSGDLEAARELLERVLALDPKNAMAHANLGALYARLGQPERALAAFQAAAAADPTLATAHFNLGLLYRRLGQSERALAAFRQAEALDPRLTQNRQGGSAASPK